MMCAHCQGLVPMGRNGRERFFCSRACNIRYHNARRRERLLARRPPCPVCGNPPPPIKGPGSRHLYCSPECARLARNAHERETRWRPVRATECEMCGAVMDNAARPGRPSGYCSVRCRRRANPTQRDRGYVRHSIAVWRRDDWTCRLCGDPLLRTHGHHPLGPTLDHVVPVTRWDQWVRDNGHPGYGVDDPENLQAAHRRCNSSKGNRFPERVLT